MGQTTPPNKGDKQANQGEGNKTADRNYREATTKFVESERGQREIRKAGDVSAEQDKDIKRAEQEAKSHAKGHDPTDTRTRSRPS